jgi:phosphoserine phosphatase
MKQLNEIKKPLDQNAFPLVVDLDGTLINADVLVEELKALLRKNVLFLFPCIFWLLKGKVTFKEQIHNRTGINPEVLPYNQEILDFIEEEAGKGQIIILATASLKVIADEIGKILPVFREIYGTENDLNLRGIQKRELLIRKFGMKGFDYIGNSHSDLVIFRAARYSYLVNPSKSLLKKTNELSELKKIWYFPNH